LGRLPDHFFQRFDQGIAPPPVIWRTNGSKPNRRRTSSS
jgi:hypothetical protein